MSGKRENTAMPAPKNADPRLRPAPAGTPSGLKTLILAGGLSAAIFGSRVILQTIQSEPDMLYYDSLRRVGLVWNSSMKLLHATAPDTALHALVRKAENARF
jgi:hypothetical protein